MSVTSTLEMPDIDFAQISMPLAGNPKKSRKTTNVGLLKMRVRLFYKDIVCQ